MTARGRRRNSRQASTDPGGLLTGWGDRSQTQLTEIYVSTPRGCRFGSAADEHFHLIEQHRVSRHRPGTSGGVDTNLPTFRDWVPDSPWEWFHFRRSLRPLRSRSDAQTAILAQLLLTAIGHGRAPGEVVQLLVLVEPSQQLYGSVAKLNHMKLQRSRIGNFGVRSHGQVRVLLQRHRTLHKLVGFACGI